MKSKISFYAVLMAVVAFGVFATTQQAMAAEEKAAPKHAAKAGSNSNELVIADFDTGDKPNRRAFTR